MKESVTIAYHRADATHHVILNERPGRDREPEWMAYGPPSVDVERVERDGQTFTVYRPGRRQGIPLTLVCERDGTAIQLSSTDLDEDVLVELAASVEPLD